MSATLLHLDMDAFFADIEQRDRPELRGKPVVVGARPGGRGVVSTCSYEARRFGIHSAMPINEAYRLCPHAVFVRSNMQRYAEASDGVMRILERYSPLVEPVSVDEAYVDLSGSERLLGDARTVATHIKKAILNELHLSASVGIGPNRLIAKIASDHDKPDGLVIVEPGHIQAFLDPLPVRVLRGVGAKLEADLHRHGLRQIWHLRRWTLARLQSAFGQRTGCMLHRQAQGQGSSHVGTGHARKQISKERTFAQDLVDVAELKRHLSQLAAAVCRSARAKGLRGRVVVLKLRLQGFETHTRQRRIENPTASDRELLAQAWQLFEQSGFAGRPVRLIGVGLRDWGAVQPREQLDFFAPETDHQNQEEAALYHAIDAIQERFGTGALVIGEDLPSRSRPSTLIEEG